MKHIVSIAASMAASLAVAQADVITAWTFENDSIAVNDSPAPSTGSGIAGSIGMATYATPSIGVTTDDVLEGATGDTGTNGDTDLTNIWRVRAQAAIGGGASNGWSSTAPIGAQGAVFSASTVGYSNINVSFDWYATTQGEANLQLQYTTDGATWKNVPLTLSGADAGLAVKTNTTSTNTVNGSYVSITGGGQGWFTGLTATISDPNAANNPKFAIQMVNASTGADCISATPGQAANTVPQEIGNFSITSVVNPATGAPYTTADKAGKDNNFRGLTIFNNTLYVTKGSGSNGIDTVYQVGNAGTLPTLATAATAPITVLPGFPTASAKTAGATNDYPFGIWFANATTLYVGDEGDGVLADAAGSKTAGLQKWILSGGTWTMAYVLQNGLNLGQQYAIANYPTSLNPATAGLRNITGVVNSNGTVTIYAVTSTVSTNGDQGADPNKLVSITDTLANTTATGAASETFTTLRTANAGEVLRGISLTPSSTSMPDVPSISSAASPSVTSIAQGGLAFAVGQNLASEVDSPVGTLPATIGGTSVSIKDATGLTTNAPLIFVSPGKLTFQVPSSVAAGKATVTVTSPGSTQTASKVLIAPVAPAVFTANGNSLLVGWAISVSSTGTQTIEPALTVNADGSYAAAPINVGSATNKVYLAFYATGMDAAGLANVAVTVNGVTTPVSYSGNGGYTGIDQINVLLPASLAGSGTVTLQLTASGVAANAVQVAIQ